MTLPTDIRNSLRLPAVCAPMLGVSTPRLVIAACAAGIMTGLPRHNAVDDAQFEQWLREIRDTLDRRRDKAPGLPIGPLAVNLSARRSIEDTIRDLATCRRYGVDIIITARGDPAELARRVHDSGARIFHDVTTIRFAEKAIAAQVDGITCIAVGGGGHAGEISAFALVPLIRRMFGGILLLGGAISTGSGIRAAEALGADLAYLGTRFIATTEANADARYKAMIAAGGAGDVVFSSAVTGTGASWLVPSLQAAGIDPAGLPRSAEIEDRRRTPGMRPWRNLWSAGQGIATIDAVEPVAAVVERLAAEYRAACARPPFASPDPA